MPKPLEARGGQPLVDASKFWTAMASLRERHWAFWLLTAANFAGIGFGYYYYWQVGQFNPASQYYQHWSLWAFVSDSPNAVLLMQVSLSLWYFGRKRYRLLDSLAFIHLVYIGFWTTFLFTSEPDQLGTWEWGGTNNLLYFSHMGMPLEALILVKGLRRDTMPAWMPISMLGWVAVNLFLDYGAPALRPAPFVAVEDWFAGGAVLLMGLSLVLWMGTVYGPGSNTAKELRLPPPG
jgi:uncharacterized membrane protein YpjA